MLDIGCLFGHSSLVMSLHLQLAPPADSILETPKFQQNTMLWRILLSGETGDDQHPREQIKGKTVKENIADTLDTDYLTGPMFNEMGVGPGTTAENDLSTSISIANKRSGRFRTIGALRRNTSFFVSRRGHLFKENLLTRDALDALETTGQGVGRTAFKNIKTFMDGIITTYYIIT